MDKLREDDYDVTSLLYRRRDELAKVLGRATGPARFDERDVRLLVRLGPHTWIVDTSGTVRCGRSSARLSEVDFVYLRHLIRLSLPDKSSGPQSP